MIQGQALELKRSFWFPPRDETKCGKVSVKNFVPLGLEYIESGKKNCFVFEPIFFLQENSFLTQNCL